MANPPKVDRVSQLSTQATDELSAKDRFNTQRAVEFWRHKANYYCKSEIEKLFFLAFWTIKELDARQWGEENRLEIVSKGNRDAPTVSFDKVARDPSYLASKYKRVYEATGGGWPIELNYIWPQVPIGPYSADFVLCRASFGCDEDDLDVEYIETVKVSVPVIVECDGHDFHERTKEQALHDRKRDRHMQSLGYPVMRFTGRELYRDPLRCAKEVDKYLDSPKSLAKEQYLCLL